VSEATVNTSGLADTVVHVDKYGFGGHRAGQGKRADRAAGGASPAHDPVTHPPHYTWLPLGVEVIDITELFNFRLGNTLKYILRSGRKADGLEDLKKAKWYLSREIKRREQGLP
jgi:hypothetical protein